MALNIPFRNAYYRFASSYSFLFFISWSLWWSLYAIWLKGHLGLTGTELGTLYSVNQFTSILFMMFYGIVQDKLGLKKPLFSCLLCRFIRITRCRNAPVWLSQLIPGGTRSAVHGDYSFLCESGRAKKCITYRSCDYGVAYPFLRAVR